MPQYYIFICKSRTKRTWLTSTYHYIQEPAKMEAYNSEENNPKEPKYAMERGLHQISVKYGVLCNLLKSLNR